MDRARAHKITRAEIAQTLGQDPEHVLMGHFERHLRELGERTPGGSFLALARSGDGSAEALATELASWDTWYDISPYQDSPSRSSSAPRSPPRTSRWPGSPPPTTCTG